MSLRLRDLALRGGRVVAVPAVLTVSIMIVVMPLAPLTDWPDRGSLIGGMACIAGAVAGLAWVAWQTDVTARELLAWVVAFRVLTLLLPHPIAFRLGLGVGAARFARRCLAQRPRGSLSAPALAALMAFAAASYVYVDRLRPAPDPGRHWCTTEGEPGGIAVLGDSSSYGFMIPANARYSRLIGASVNCARIKAASPELADQLAEAEAANPRVVVVYIGANDAVKDDWQGLLRANLAALVERNRAAGRETVLVTYPYGSLVRPQWIGEASEIVRSIPGARVVDAERAIRSPLAFLADDVHPSTIGHRRIAALLQAELAQASRSGATPGPR